MNIIRLFLLLLLTVSTSLATAETYLIDTKDMHASINFEIPHLGYSLLTGRFNRFTGKFIYDSDDPSASSVYMVIETGSVDSNHAERDKHLRSKDFLNSKKYPEARFVSTSFSEDDSGAIVMMGDFTLNGISKPLTIHMRKVGEGEDPWGGYRMGFSGETSFLLTDFGIMKSLGEHSKEVVLQLNIEGVREE
jgi:polyisoprenoid-binding protein YceI